MTENNGENVEHMIVDVDISLEEGMDPSKTTEYLEKLFRVGAKFGEDLEHINHGKIDVKSSSLQDYGRWYWYPARKNPLPGRNKKQILCDTFVCIGYGHKRTNIDAVLIIPSKYCDVSTINYNKDSKRGNKYGIFVVDPTSYNDAHHSLMAYLKNKKYFGIEYIKEWMKL